MRGPKKSSSQQNPLSIGLGLGGLVPLQIILHQARVKDQTVNQCSC